MSKKINAIITLISLLFLTALGIFTIRLVIGLLQQHPLLSWPATALMLLLLILSAALHAKRRRKQRDSEHQFRAIDDMEGYQFEEYIAAMLQRHGYGQVEITRKSGDYGADITAVLNGEMIGFQCKRSQQNVGVQGVKDISAGMQYYGCSRGAVITNQYFTRQARELAEKCSIELWDRDTLKEMIS